jgi:hypothetical protein
MRRELYELLAVLDDAGAARASRTREIMHVLLSLLGPEDKSDTMRFINEYADPPPAPKPRLQVISGGLS